MDKKKVGENVRRERIKNLLTQSELAERAGLAQMTISRIENGTRVSITSIRLIADALKVSAATLMRGAV